MTGARAAEPPLSLADRRVLLASPFGRGLTPRDLAVLLGRGLPDAARVRPLARLVTARPGQRLALAAQPQDEFLVVLAGRVEVVRHRADGTRRVLDHVGPGAACGAVTAFGAVARWPADVEAVEPVRALAISSAALRAEAEPDETRQRLLRNCVGVLAERALHLSARAELFNRRGLRERLAFWLTQQADADARVPGTLTRQALADHLGVSRASMTRELGRMTDDGLIRLEGRGFRVLESARLRALAE